MLPNAVTIAQPIEIEQSDSLRFLPEGPIAMGDSTLSWVGIQHGAESKVGSINVLDLATKSNRSFNLPGRPGFAFPTEQSGVFVAGVERSLGLFDTNDGGWKPFCDDIDDDVTNTIINDGVRFGDNLIFGTKDLEFATKKAGLYLYRSVDQTLVRLRDDQICSNGKSIIDATDHKVTFLDIDSPTRTVVRYELNVDSGKLSDPETVLDFEGDQAVPDGQILSSDGRSIIVAMFRPGVADHGETRMYDLATGNLQHVFVTPGSPQNTCPAIVRHDGQSHLVITTAVENFSDDDVAKCPQAGRLFIAPLPK